MRSQASSQPRCASSSRIRINSGTASVGCVSLSWIATLSGSVFQSALLRRKRRTRSASEQATRKYSCTKRSACPMLGGVVGIQHPRQGFGRQRPGQRADEIAAAEFLKVEIVGRRGGPQPQRVDGLAAVADHRPVKRDADQGGGPAGDGVKLSAAHLERAAELDFDRLVADEQLPRVLPAQPVVRLFALPAVLIDLPEDAVFVAQPVAHGRQLHRRHRVEEARRQPAEPAVAQAGVGLLLDQAEPVEVLLLGSSLHEGIEQQIGHVVGQRAPDQKLHRQIVDALRVLAVVGALGPHPALRQDIPDRAGGRLKLFARAGSARIDDVVEQQMPLVEGVVGSGEPDRTAAVLLEKDLPEVR